MKKIFKKFSWKKFCIRFFIVAAILALSFVFYAFVYGNFHRLSKDAYRSAQLFSFNLGYYVKTYKIKTVINLRGENSDKDWYKTESKILKKLGVNHINYRMSSKKYIGYDKANAIVKILKHAKKPVLIHCAGGADRTSLVSALYQYGVRGKSKAEARKEFSIFYGYAPFIKKELLLW